jgi:hypothetical protein
MGTILYCSDMPEEVQKLCCTSCHEDVDEGYAMAEYYEGELYT